MNFMGNGITRFSQMSEIRAFIYAQLLSDEIFFIFVDESFDLI